MMMEATETEQKKSEALNLKLTDGALEQVKSMLAREKLEGHGLRVGVTGGGCSGFSYVLDFEKDEKPGDVILERGNVKVYVSAAAAKYLQGTVIDYVSGLYGAGFKFSNPNATGTCGCGTSFSA